MSSNSFVTSYGKRLYKCDNIKDLEMERLFWVSQMGMILITEVLKRRRQEIRETGKKAM